MIKRIGFACKYSKLENNKIVSIPDCNTKTTTLTWINKQSKHIQEEKLWCLTKHNIQSIYNTLVVLSTLDIALRMFRISSDILPFFTHDNFNWFWSNYSVQQYCETEFNKVGLFAKEHDIRLSFHPGQFCCLASDKDHVIQNSIKEIEYHATMAKWLGYGSSFNDNGFKINVHVSGKGGIDQFILSYNKLSSTARNLLTIENDEISCGLDSCLSANIPIVLDLHHHFIYSGEYIDDNDDRIKRIIDSWRGIRPVIHYSCSKEDLLLNHSLVERPNLDFLIKNNYTKQQLRAHSNFMWHPLLNEWARSHWEHSDIMVEAKGKNLASFQLYKLWS